MDYRIAIIIPNTPAFETAKKLLEKKISITLCIKHPVPKPWKSHQIS